MPEAIKNTAKSIVPDDLGVVLWFARSKDPSSMSVQALPVKASDCTAAVAAACFAPFFVVASPWYTYHIQPLFIYLFYITTKW